MAENPNPTPGFIRQGGILGSPVALTTQFCNRDSPGNVPLVLYDNDSTTGYASGNGAIVENLVIAPTGVIIKNVLLIFIKLLNDSSPIWRFYDDVDMPQLAVSSTNSKNAGYPLKASLSRNILSVPSRVGSNPYPNGFRINGSSVPLQIGVALGVSNGGTQPIYVWLEGGEL